MKLFMFAASLRQASINKKLIRVIADKARQLGHEVDLAEFSEFELPLYNGDTQDNNGIPAAATAFVKRMQQADGTLIASPEYNFSIPGILKNLIDWVSRISPMPWQDQRILLCSASPALVGGNRGLWATRMPLEACGALVYPDMFSLAAAYDAFMENGQLKDAALQQRLHNTLEKFLLLLQKLAS